ncbi:NADPH-dependent F420 reductase [Kineococcus indalonis]|uniref:NADPH-dependent F420 reductase n=1 Tax=Kineococcus indalonis TaxID=2696566 RepID=UPI001412B2B1|nr:NAD(P)-binding domain-containing protein [Kineococcus indalonis]
MATLGVIGSGSIGTAVARLAIAAGVEVVLSNSRGPQTLTSTVAGLGEAARAATPQEAARAGDQVVVAVPLTAYRSLPVAALRGKVVLDTINYYATRDGHLEDLDSGRTTTSELVQAHLVGARTVKAFNNIAAFHIPALARPVGAPDRSALPIAGNDAAARAQAAELIGRLGFDTVDVGPLSQSWRFEPETAAYAPAYAADPAAVLRGWQQVVDDLRAGRAPRLPAPDAGSPLSAARLGELLAGAERELTADRVVA